jgi:hypothetical protein
MGRPRRRLLAAALLGLAATTAFALDEDALRRAMPADVADDAILADWPGVPDRTLVAWADDGSRATGQAASAPTPSGQDMPDMIHLDVLVVETSTGREVQRFHEDKAYPSLRGQFDHLEIDTAGYTLAPGRRAFGVRMVGVHHGFASQETAILRLLEPAGATLRPVLALETFDLLAYNDCGEGHETRRTVAIGRTSTRGHADLVVHEKRAVTPDGSAHPDRCNPKIRRSERTVTLHFDGTRYPELLH